MWMPMNEVLIEYKNGFGRGLLVSSATMGICYMLMTLFHMTAVVWFVPTICCFTTIVSEVDRYKQLRKKEKEDEPARKTDDRSL
jgi:hypothetical protein